MKYALLALLTVLPLAAQEEQGSGGMYGYTAIDYDETANQINAYSETDIDGGGLSSYYHPIVGIVVSDDHGNYYAKYCSWSGDGETYDSVSCTGIPATAGYVYTATGEHQVNFVIVITCSGAAPDSKPAKSPVSTCKCGCGNQYYWLDPDDYDYFSSLGLDDPFGADYFASGPSNDVYEDSSVLGKSFDTATVGPVGVCGDPLDSLIAQYTDYGAVFHPTCSCFLTPTEWTYQFGEQFTFGYLTPDEDAPWAGNWAALLPAMGNNLVSVYKALGYPVNGLANQHGVVGSISSGYRNPASEAAADKQAGIRFVSDSRHMAGDAVDMRVGTANPTNDYGKQWTAAKNTGACVEPYPSKMPHTHMDWRRRSRHRLSVQTAGKCTMIVVLFIALSGAAQSCPAAAQLSGADKWYYAKKIVETTLRQCSLADPEVQHALIENFERENADPRWFDNAEYDQFNTYDDELGTAVQKIATEYHVPAAFRALARANYNDDGPFAQWLAGQPDAFPYFLEAARSHDERVQGEGIVMLGKALGECERPGTAENCAAILAQKDEVLALLRRDAQMKSHEGLVESNAVQGLGYCGERQDLALLDRVLEAWLQRSPGSDWNSVQARKSSQFVIDSAKHKIEARLKAAALKEQPVSAPKL